MSRLSGKVVLITGASSGFGEDTARLFAKKGCKLVLAARRLDRMQKLVELVRAQGGEAIALAVDITQQADIDEMVKSALDQYGQIDILFNNAGFGRLDWLENLDPESDIKSQVNVNLLGLIQTTRAVIPHMLARGSGQIINMSSVAGRIGAPLYTIYAATKFGVRGFTDALRREVAPFGIRVSGIYPGPAVTEFSQHTGRNSAKSAMSRFKGLSMTSEYVAGRVVGLARHPRRTLVIPWWYRGAVWISDNFPALVDWFLLQFFTKQHHKLHSS
jgi:NADP-dependent 3-hydroxy acid dehydrogenase YdfG